MEKKMEKMKKLLCISLILFAFACASDPQKEMEKAIVGEWCNPYTYQSTGELKGFNFKKGGVCESINIPSLELKSWEIKDGYLKGLNGELNTTIQQEDGLIGDNYFDCNMKEVMDDFYKMLNYYGDDNNED